jgi:DNA-binding response OmpR family regulator
VSAPRDRIPVSVLAGIDLPAAVAASAVPRRRVALVAATVGADERALLGMLEGGGLLCLPVEEEAEALTRALRWEPDLILFASKAPLAERVRWLVLLRERAQCPVVMLGACRDDSDELVLLEAGFDAVWRDVTPARLPARLLRSRVEALLRSRGAPQRRGARVWIGPLSVDSETLTARRDGRPLALTRAQVQVLHALAGAPLQTLARAQIAAVIGARGDGQDGALSLRRVDTLVSRLRTRLAELALAGIDVEPVRGYGYRLRIDEQGAVLGATSRATPSAAQRQAMPMA